MTLTVSGRWADMINGLLGEGPTPDTGCEHCGREFAANHSRKQRFCSLSCKQMAWKAQQPKPVLPDLPCKVCGKPAVKTSLVGRRPKTCSDCRP